MLNVIKRQKAQFMWIWKKDNCRVEKVKIVVIESRFYKIEFRGKTLSEWNYISPM